MQYILLNKLLQMIWLHPKIKIGYKFYFNAIKLTNFVYIFKTQTKIVTDFVVKKCLYSQTVNSLNL